MLVSKLWLQNRWSDAFVMQHNYPIGFIDIHIQPHKTNTCFCQILQNLLIHQPIVKIIIDFAMMVITRLEHRIQIGCGH